MFKFISAVVLVAIVALGFWLAQIMPDQGWAVWDHEALGWRVVAAGWATLLHSWPLTLLGGVVGGSVVFGLLGFAFSRAIDADHQREIQRLKREIEAAKTASEAARGVAAAELAEDRAEVEKLRIEALSAREQGHQMQLGAKREIEAAQGRMLAAERRASEAAHRAKNAIMTLKRKTGDTIRRRPQESVP